jgi:hypothetical protein
MAAEEKAGGILGGSEVGRQVGCDHAERLLRFGGGFPERDLEHGEEPAGPGSDE